MSQLNKIIKPWGYEDLIETNDKYVLKKLFMISGNRCSLQYHNKKMETIYLLNGILRIIVGKSKNSLSEKLYYPGDSITIEPGLIHRMEAVEDSLYLEVSTPELDDVVRLEDDYSRIQK
jgi:mannose-6-phosphate isomerase